MYSYPWPLKGICLGAPQSGDIGLFERFVNERLQKDGINTLVLLTRYRYAFDSHPECRADNPLSYEDARRIKKICSDAGIELIPKMNLMGHQSGKSRESMDGLFRGHPEFDETPDLDTVEYCRSLCPSNGECLNIVCNLMDEMCDAFGASTMHIGCDEVFEIGKCPICRKKSNAELFAGWINSLYDHLAERGRKTMMWGDRLLNGNETGYGGWEASNNGTDPAIDMLPKDIIICDWHYEMMEKYPSVDVFADHGYEIIICPWRYRANAHAFADYAVSRDRGHIKGLMITTWCDPKKVMLELLGTPVKDEGGWNAHELVADNYRSFFVE